MINNYSNLLQTNNNISSNNNFTSMNTINSQINNSSTHQTSNIQNNQIINQDNPGVRISTVACDNFPKINLQVKKSLY